VDIPGLENFHKIDPISEKLPFADKEFDFVYSRHVLEDSWNPFALCEEMSRVGKSGYIETPSPIVELGRGVDQYRVDTIVFSRKQLVPPGASTLANYSIMNRPMTTNSLIAFCPGIPSLILRNLQTAFATGFWFAGAPDVQQIDANRIQVDQQWVYGDTYSTFIYGPPI
jgi:hypothetical protein